MKIAISSMGRKSSDLMDPRFGRCECFQVYDTERKEYGVLDNESKSSGQGAGIGASQFILDQGVDALVTGKLGPNAFEVLATSDMELYTSESIAVEEVVALYERGELQKLESPGVGHAGLGASGERNRYRGGN